MSDTILLILRIPESYDDKIALKRTNGLIDVVAVKDEKRPERQVLEHAFLCAKNLSMPLTVLLIMSSSLYHWGFNDIILTDPAKTRFIYYIREELMRRAEDLLKVLEERSRHYDVAFTIQEIETRDPVIAALEEAKKGYQKIFIAKEKIRIFPIFKKTLEHQLEKRTSAQIISVP